MRHAVVAVLWMALAFYLGTQHAGAQTAAAAAPVPVNSTSTIALPAAPLAATAANVAAATATLPGAAAAPLPITTNATAAVTPQQQQAAETAAAVQPKLPRGNIVPTDPGSPFPLKAGAMAHLRAMAANASFPTQDVATAAPRGFVVRNGSHFYHNGRPFYFIGGNSYWLIDFYTLRWGREQIDEFLDHVKALGLAVIRTWMFNDSLPKAFASYDARQLAGLDYIIWAAKKRNIMLNFCFGNLWNHYKGPEDFLAMATGTAEKKDILDFYRDPATRALYKLHIWGLISRVNPLTGLAPKDDPTIFSWNLLNEPRCPGCMEAEQQAIHQDWLSDMAKFLRAADPLHLISAATEGFFVEDRATFLHFHNPGPGAQCDGEDWFKISTIPELDYTTIHVYERHMELLPRPSGSDGDWPNWVYCDWECYINWFKHYVQLHAFLAAEVLHKPLLVEEFGLTWWKKTQDQQRVLFNVAFKMLQQSAEAGGALAGTMFWNAADDRVIDSDGYNVKITKPQYYQQGSALPDPTNLPVTMVNQTMADLLTPDNGTKPVPPNVIFTASTAPPALQAQMNVQPPVVVQRPAVPAATAVLPAAAAAAAAASANATAAAALPAPATAAAAAATTVPAVPATTPAAVAVTPAAAAAAVPAVAATVPAATTAAVPAVAATPAAVPAPAVAAAPVAAAAPTVTNVSTTPLPVVQASDTVSSTPASFRANTAVTGRKLLLDGASVVTPDTNALLSYSMSSDAVGLKHQRSLLVSDALDGFRRGGWREACAKEAAKTWRPYKLFNITDTITTVPENVRWLQGGDVVQIISAATARLNRLLRDKAGQ